MTEERFTRASSFCPHPEYWHSPDSEATEAEVSEFIGALVRIIQPEFVLETGTYHGHTALEIGISLYANSHGQLVSIEKDKLAYIEATNKLLEVSYLPVTLLNMNTMDYTPDRDIDFAFFDSWQEGRHLEFKRFYDMGRLKAGAIVAFHDSAPHHLVYRLIKDNLIDTGFISEIQFHTPRGLLLGQVQYE
jgi:predicted O-methyltransferase YrrM